MKYPDMLVVTVKTEKGTYQGQGSLKSVYVKKENIHDEWSLWSYIGRMIVL